jgi:ketosteroid isomerase-like protein
MTDDDQQAALSAVMDFLNGYAKADLDGCMRIVAASTPILLFGTNDNEVFTSSEDVRDALTRDFAAMSDIRWGETRHSHVVAGQAFANVLLELPISYRAAGKKVETLFRYALTLAKEGRRWKICGGMAGVPAPSGTYAFGV